ncbi:MAG: tetratricopeptide repeat protein [Pseudomonadota bacterium]|nr:tetratricopeptide repeat protein [Pseudomonadota bacterium]
MNSSRCAAALAVAAACSWPLEPGAQPPRDATQPAAPPGILDPRFAVMPLEGALEEMRRNRQAAPALERYEAEDYREAARLGLGILAVDPEQHGLRFAVANSLAWTGRYDPAIEHYRALLGTRYESQARLGIANVRLWSGQPELAESLYLDVLEREPGNAEAQRSLRRTGRELRPSASLRIVQTEDNQNFARDELWLTYRRWSEDRTWRFDVGALHDRNKSPLADSTASGLQGSVWAVRLPLSPKLEASIYDSEVFATMQLEPFRDRLQIRLGHVNWGRMAFNASALAAGLTADTLGVFAEAHTFIGSLRGRLEGYDISDGNRVIDGELQLTPARQRLPWRLEWFGGVYGRGADREDPRYWSPRPAYGLAFLGLRRTWSTERADVTASTRAGVGFTDTAKGSWSLGLSGRYWLTNDVAIGLEAWTVDAPRPAEYRVQQVAAFVQHLW